jgi:hypothetical protein
MPDLYAQIGEPTEWCLVQSYPDGTAVIATWGPFKSEQEAKDAIPLLRHVVDNVTLDVVPFRRITPGRPPHKPGIRGELTVHGSGGDTG